MYEDIIQKLRIEGDASSAIKAQMDLMNSTKQVTSVFRAEAKVQADMAALGPAAFAKAAEQTKISVDNITNALKQHDQVLQAHARNTQQATSTVDKLGSMFMTAGKAALGLGAANYVVNESMRRIGEAYEATLGKFTESERAMGRMRNQMGSTAEESKTLRKELFELSARTGEDVNNLTASLSKFSAQSGLTGDAAMKAFKQTALAADLAGVSTETMSRVTIAALRSMKVPVGELGSVLGTVEGKLHGMSGEFATALPRMAKDMRSVGLEGPELVKQMAAVSEAVKKHGSDAAEVAEVNEKLTTRRGAVYLGGEDMATRIKSGQTYGQVLGDLVDNLERWGMFSKENKDRLEQEWGKGGANALRVIRDLRKELPAGAGEFDKYARSSLDAAEAHRKLEHDAQAAKNEINALKDQILENIAEMTSPAHIAALKLLKGLLTPGPLVPMKSPGMEYGPPIPEDYVAPTPPEPEKPKDKGEYVEPAPEGYKFKRGEGYLPVPKRYRLTPGKGRGYEEGAPTPTPPPPPIPDTGEGGLGKGTAFGGGYRPASYTPGSTEDQAMWARIHEAVSGDRRRKGGPGMAYTPGAGEPAPSDVARVTMAGLNTGGAYGRGGGGGVQQASYPGGGAGTSPYSGGGGDGGGRRGGGDGGSGGDGATPASGGPDLGGTGTAKVGETGPEFTPGGGGGGGQDGGRGPGLAADRAGYAKELEGNPALREKIMRIAANEQGSNPQGTQAVIEALMNRASYQGISLERAARWRGEERGYYARGNMGRNMNREVIEKSLQRALEGGNISRFATDNSSGRWGRDRINRGMYRQTSEYGGEQFSTPGTGAGGPGAGMVRRYNAWRERVERGGGGGAPPTAGTTPQPATGTPAQPSSSDASMGGKDALYEPITSSNFMGGVGANSASRGRGAHQGEDWGAPVGTPVHAVKDGVLERIGTDNFGKPIAVIRHDDGTYTRDMHMNTIDVKVGQRVVGGKAYGTSGTANGVPHLHHERWQGQPGRRGSRLISPAAERGRSTKVGMQGGRQIRGTPGTTQTAGPGAPTGTPADVPAPFPQTNEGGLGKGVAFEGGGVGESARTAYERGPVGPGSAAQDAYQAGRRAETDVPMPRDRPRDAPERPRRRDITAKLPDVRKWRREVEKPIELDVRPGPNVRKNYANERRIRRMENNDASLGSRRGSAADIGVA